MTLFSLSFIYLCFYYIALVLTFLRTQAGDAPKARNSVAAMIIGAVGLLLIYVPAFFAPGSAAALILIAALALVPVFLLGLGSLIGLWIAGLKPRIILQSALVTIAMVAPFTLIWQLTGGPTVRDQNFAQYQEQLAAFQKTTVSGRLGRYPISMPASPQIDAYYTCIEPANGRIAQCHAHFGLDAGLGRLPGDIPIFHQINVARKSEDCTVSCMNFERLASWCSTRSDMALQEWCSREPSEGIIFSYDENRTAPKAGGNGWEPAPVSLEDALLECRDWDQGKLCRAHYDIERNLQVTIVMPEATAENLQPRYGAARAYVSRLWDAMKTSAP